MDPRKAPVDLPERTGQTSPAHARLLADAERASGETPVGCEWLDDQTAADLDVPLVFQAVDRTKTITGAQSLWRWLVAPAVDRSVLDTRERKVQLLGDAALRRDVEERVPLIGEADAEYIPELLWHAPPALRTSMIPIVLFAAMIACLVFLPFHSTLIVPLLVLGSASSLYDMVAQRALARHADALGVLGSVLDGAARVSQLPLPAELRGDIDRDLGIRAKLSKRLLLLRINDPFGLFELLRAMFLVRVLVVHRCVAIVAAERERLRRIVLWVGELDALQAVAQLRERDLRVRVPDITDDPAIEAGNLAHPALANAVGNDVAVRGGLLVTGSNASGKSTFLRAVAINVVLAQSLRITFGTWRAPLMRVRCAMRINDDLARGLSTYAAEVASVGRLVHAAEEGGPLTLFVLDEPFHGTNPVVRVPIVVAVLEHLGASHLVLAATHDLDVAQLVSDRFERCYFTELESGGFDRKLKLGIAPSSNALALLERAGYPPAVLSRIEALRAR